MRALHGRESGFSEVDLAELLGVARETVSRWWSAYVQGGLDAIPHDRIGRPVGSGRILSNEQAITGIQIVLNEQMPQERGITSPLWTRRAVRDLIQQMFGIAMPVTRTVGEYLKRWGYTPKKPQRLRALSRPRRGSGMAGKNLPRH